MEEMDPIPTPSRPWWRNPYWLGLVGLALMVIGYKVSSLTQEDLREMGLDSAPREEGVPVWLARPPYQTPGRLVFFGGTVLVVTAGIWLFRAPAEAPPRDAAPEDEERAAG